MDGPAVSVGGERGTFERNSAAALVLTRDAQMLLLIVAGFCWFALAVFARKATVDFSVMYMAGGLIADGHRAQLFDLAAQTEFQRSVLGLRSPLPFIHLAYEALIFAPLALLPFRVALWVWRLVCFAMLVWSCGLLSEVFGASRRAILLLAVALFPVALAIVQGQDSMLTLLLFSGAFAALARNRDGMGGVLTACALFKPQLALPLAAILMWKRGWRFASGWLGGAIALVVVSSVVTGLQGWRGLVRLMRYAGSSAGDEIGATSWARPNLRGFIDLFGLNAKTTVELTLALSAILFVAVAWRLRGVVDVRSLFPPVIALTLIVSLNANLHAFSLLLISVVALLLAQTRLASLCVGACYCMPVFMFMGHIAFFVLATAVLVATMSTLPAEEKQQRAVNA